jgi:adenylate cyclase
MMDSYVPPESAWISSKEILEQTGISRATLNNYIRIGILPRPVVQRPTDPASGAKKIGYFPLACLERIQFVHRLKKEGKSMGEIVALFRDETTDDLPGDGTKGDLRGDETEEPPKERPLVTESGPERLKPAELRLSFDEVTFPAYFLNYDFDLLWINREAEVKLFKRTVKLTEKQVFDNIFRLLFHWEFHRQVVNWKNLVQFHMSHAKLVKPGKRWIGQLYRGISEAEIFLLERIYDHVHPVPAQTIREGYVSLLSREGSSDLFKVHSMFTKQGIFFIYVVEETASHCSGISAPL